MSIKTERHVACVKDVSSPFSWRGDGASEQTSASGVSKKMGRGDEEGAGRREAEQKKEMKG